MAWMPTVDVAAYRDRKNRRLLLAEHLSSTALNPSSATTGLGLVQHDVGTLHELFELLTLLHAECDANAGGDVQTQAAHHKRLGNHAKNFFSCRMAQGLGRKRGQDDRKLIATHPCDAIVRPNGSA
jgi:hypothetical protein